MKYLNGLKFIGIALLLAVGLSACDKPGPAETAGKKIDQTVDKAGDKINEVGDKINDAADKAGESMSDEKK
jgi:hypothetical protein